ncbi:hypothetical protein N0V93_002096 [Gnomoniopsis smithogilvyi]|uniref:Cytochrome P450 n=1 Tax=Gnomoniopsis smithogilvyi TaxID=1191159 RepID=A0A9W8Z6T3_9PEZI|nr:hypothetical protein N0V93_002096 [Gnomoniopsis smithogilvyi]
MANATTKATLVNMTSGEWLVQPEVLVPTVVLLFYVIYNYFLFPVPPSLSKLRILNSHPNEWFAYFRALYRNTVDLRKTLHLHHTYHKHETVRAPILGPGQEKLILLPYDQRKWLIDQPESILSMHQQTDQHFQFDYGTIYPTRDHQQVHIHLVTTKLTSQIGNLIPTVAEELDLALKEHWGGEGPGRGSSSQPEWKEVCVYETLRLIIGQTINRIFLGEALCRNRELLDTAVAYAQWVPVSAQLLTLLPKWVRGLVAPLITLPSRWYERRWFKITLTEVRSRLEARRLQSKGTKENTGTHSGATKDNDFLDWLITYGESSDDPYLLDAEVLAARILLLNAFALHTTVFAITHMILDLVGSGERQGSKYITELRQEISDVLDEHSDGGEWDKRVLARLERLDSTFRESQRVNTVLTVGPLRIVSHKDGVTTPSGVHVPKGYQVGIPAYSIHHAEDIWGADAGLFDPFRHSNKRRNAQATGDHVRGARQAWATTSPEYLSFGAGKNSCPGRFFAAGLLKVLMANILLKYDFEYQEKRPDNVWFGTNHLPPTEAKIRIRRRLQQD